MDDDKLYRVTAEQLRNLAFEAGGAATAPLLADHPDYTFPSERAQERVQAILDEKVATFFEVKPPEDKDPLATAKYNMENGRLCINAVNDYLRMIEGSDEDKTGALVISNLVSAIYAPLSALAYLGIQRAEAAAGAAGDAQS